MAPGGVHEAPRARREEPRSPEEAPRCPEKATKTLPGGSQDVPKWPDEGLDASCTKTAMRAPESVWIAQEVLAMSPQGSPEGPHSAPRFSGARFRQ